MPAETSMFFISKCTCETYRAHWYQFSWKSNWFFFCWNIDDVDFFSVCNNNLCERRHNLWLTNDSEESLLNRSDSCKGKGKVAYTFLLRLRRSRLFIRMKLVLKPMNSISTSISPRKCLLTTCYKCVMWRN